MAIKLNTTEFIDKAIKVHGDKYCYDNTVYKNSKEKVTIYCKIHGYFDQTPNSHLNGSNCPKCSREAIISKNRSNKDEFILKANRIHNKKYEYNKICYKNSLSKLKIKCPIHGYFEQVANYHLSGYGCPKCGGSAKLSTDDFVKKSIKIHGNKYDYSKVKYKNSISKVIIICKEHGEFDQNPNKHLSGRGCPYCAGNKIPDYSFIIKKSSETHNNKYRYAGINGSALNIICQNHGEFKQKYHLHIKGHGCPKCGIDTIKNKSRMSLNDFVNKSKKIHGNKYDYSKALYQNSKSKITIICKEHGEFKQSASDHMCGHGCMKCSILDSDPILEIQEFLKSNNIKYILNDRKSIPPYEIDILVPSKNLGIEFHGLHWHSYNYLETINQKMKHHNKASLANKNNINLIQIFEHEWAYKKELVKSILINKLNLTSNRVYARNCVISSINNRDYYDFLNLNHIQGSTGSRYKFGLFYNNVLVMVVGINKHNKHDFELSRVATFMNHSVVGGFSKILKHFNKRNHGTIISYCDRRYSVGNLYLSNCFNLSHITKPNYFYVRNKKVYSRQQFQKHKLSKKLDSFDNDLSESQNMFNNGYRRAWDAGHYVFTRNFLPLSHNI